MDCCARHVAAGRSFFGFLAKLYERRYRRKGLDETQREMLAALAERGLEGCTVLDIGCGVGVLHQTLLERGARAALGIDLAPRMLELAARRAGSLGLESRTRYRLGDFVELAAEIEPADVTVLDKVVCCYPDPEALLKAAIRRTRRTLALTYPRKHLAGELCTALWNLGCWLARSDFRSFVHDPRGVQAEIENGGLRCVFHHQSFLWHTQVYAA